jgi:hypothetical protein
MLWESKELQYNNSMLDIREYITSNYPPEALNQFIEEHGDNGWDMLMSSMYPSEVDELLEPYLE